MLLQLFVFIVAYWAYSQCKDVGTDKNIRYQRKRYITLVMVLFTIQSGFRNVAIGSDTFQYFSHFTDDVSYSWSEMWQNFLQNLVKDPGYMLLEKVFSTIMPNFRLYLIFVAAFFFWTLGRFLIRYSVPNTMVLLAVPLYQAIFYGFFSITGIRQTIATGFLLLAVPFAIEKKPLKFILFVLLAATQHKSALLFSFFYPLCFLKNSKPLLMISIAGMIPMYFLGPSFAQGLIADTIFDQYSSYLNQYEKVGAYSFIIFMVLVGVLTLVKINKIYCMLPHSNVFINAFAVGLLLTPLVMIDPSNMRVVQYFSIFGLIVFPLLCFTLANNGNRVLTFRIIYMFISFYVLLRGDSYAFFWQEYPLGGNYDAAGRLVDDFILGIL